MFKQVSFTTPLFTTGMKKTLETHRSNSSKKPSLYDPIEIDEIYGIEEKKNKRKIYAVPKSKRQKQKRRKVLKSKKIVKKLEKNLVNNEVEILHVVPTGEIFFTIPSSNNDDMYDTSIEFNNNVSGLGEPDIFFKCDCGDKHEDFNRNSCKHIGKIVSLIVEKYIKNNLKNNEELKIQDNFQNLKL